MRGRPTAKQALIDAEIRRAEESGEPAPLPGSEVDGLDPEGFARLALVEARRAKLEATRDRSWVAVATLGRAEREAYAALMGAREAAREPDDPDATLTPDQLCDQVVLPAIREWPRALQERVYLELANKLGADVATVAGVMQ